jgi:hypothetical protein
MTRRYFDPLTGKDYDAPYQRPPLTAKQRAFLHAGLLRGYSVLDRGFDDYGDLFAAIGRGESLNSPEVVPGRSEDGLAYCYKHNRIAWQSYEYLKAMTSPAQSSYAKRAAAAQAEYDAAQLARQQQREAVSTAAWNAAQLKRDAEIAADRERELAALARERADEAVQLAKLRAKREAYAAAVAERDRRQALARLTQAQQAEQERRRAMRALGVEREAERRYWSQNMRDWRRR